MLTDIIAAHYIVANSVQYYTQQFAYFRTSVADNVVVATLAHRCPRIHGEVVYQAQAFYTKLYCSNEVYNDDSLCILPNTMRRTNP